MIKNSILILILLMLPYKMLFADKCSTMPMYVSNDTSGIIIEYFDECGLRKGILNIQFIEYCGNFYKAYKKSYEPPILIPTTYMINYICTGKEFKKELDTLLNAR